MFATSERVRPCSARCSPRSVGRVTSSCSPSCVTVMSRGMRSSSSPLGPFTRTCSRSIATVTPAGTGIGCLPILDTPSPDLGEDLAADAGRTSIVTGHHAARGRDYGRAHAAQHAGNLLGVDVRAPARTRDATQPGDRRAAVLGVLQPDADRLARAVLAGWHEREGLDVALLGEYARQLALQFGGGDIDRLVRRVDRVAHAREEVRDGIGHGHAQASSWARARPRAVGWAYDVGIGLMAARYQEDLVIPGIWPLWASSRRQMRHSPNLRYTARGRPQRLQRV